MIRIKDLEFSYGTKPFTQIPDLTLHDGQLTAILGANGSGKTTLLRLISGTEKPHRGNVKTDGVRPSAKRLSYFPQDRPVPDMTAFDTVLLGRYPYGSGRSDSDMVKAEECMKRTEALAFSSRNMKTLSCGERQRVYLAMALAQDADNMLFDEPSSFLDMHTVFFMYGIMSELKNQGKCVVSVFHDIQNALTYADRLIIMKDGRIFSDGAPYQVIADKSIEEALGVRAVEMEHEGETVYLIKPLNKI